MAVCNSSTSNLQKASDHAILTVDKMGKFVLVANYGSGSVAVLPILPDGRLGEATCAIQHEGKSVNPQRQEGPHAHSINLDPANKFAIVADLGIDKLLVYQFDATKGTLKPNDPPLVATAPGAGPRHVAFHPNGKFVYAINELNSTVTAYRYDAAKGALSEIQTVSTLPGRFHWHEHDGGSSSSPFRSLPLRLKSRA
jgi:6-phosphogluconolactonase